MFNKVGILEKSHIDEEVAIARCAMLETEGENIHPYPRFGVN